MREYDQWIEAQQNATEAKVWFERIGKRAGYENNVFTLSRAYATKPKFVYCGQQTQGGQNYWESPQSFNEAMNEVIHDHFDELAKEAIGRLESQAKKRLLAMNSLVDSLKEKINKEVEAEALAEARKVQP